MKRHLLMGLSIIASIAFTISSCDDENNSIVPEDKKPSAPSGQVTDITFYTADITGKLELSKEELNQSEFGLLLSTSEDVMAVNSDKYPIKNFDKDYNFTLSLCGLDSVTTYYYRSYIYYEGNYIYSDVQNFTTRSPLDIIKTGSLSSDSCTVISRIDSKNLIDYIQTYGICYGTTLVPSLKDQFVTTDSFGVENKFNLKLHDIPFDTLVNYRAFVRINNIDFFGPTLQFQGNTVRTGSINITDYTVTSHLKINDSYKELGVCYGMDSIPTIINQKVNTTALNDSNDFKLKLINIPFDTIVYYRAYVLTEDSIYYGMINSFGGNTVTTGIIDTTTFQVQSSVRFNDGITQYGVCYSNSERPITLDKTVYVERPDSAGFYTLSLTNVPFGTVYYRSYVLKDGIAYYGDIRKFEGNSITTGDFNSETLTAKSIIKFSNSYSNPELGICYSNNQEPTIVDKNVFNTIADTACCYEFLLKNMPFGTVYYRAYMLLDGIPHYGEIKQIEGNVVTTNIFVDSTHIANSNIKYSIGYDALNLGVCYSNNENPTINDKVVTTNTVDSLNSFAIQLTEIPFGKIYYRSYMMYEGTPQYGAVKSFDGNSVTTGSFEESTLVANSSLKFSAGYEKLDLGVCYSNNENPTINDKKVTATSVDSLNSFALQLTEIPFGKVYYRSYMMYEGVPQYGAVKSFEGNAVTTGSFDVGALTANSSIRFASGYDKLNLGICYSTKEQPTINDRKVSTSNVDSLNTFYLQLTEIPFGKVYYRSYMMFGDTPYYGEVKSFDGNAITTGSFIDSSLVAISSLKFSTGYEELDLGVCYSNNENPTINDIVVTANTVDSLNSFALKLTEIPFGKVYYRSYMMYEGEPQYGAIKSFDGNEIITGICDTVNFKTVSTIKITEGYRSFDMGICYGSNTLPTINDHVVSTNKLDSINTYTIQFRGIPFGKVYYRSYIMYDGVPQYGEVKSFEGNAISTGEYDQKTLTVTSHLKIKEEFDQVSYGVCYGINSIPTLSDNNISTTEIDEDNNYTVILTKNSVGSTIYYRSFINQNGVISYGDIKSFKKQLTVEMVDLGLSVNWASFNVGSDYPHDFGGYYAWGETETKDSYSWDAKWSKSYNSLTKYCDANGMGYNGYVDNKTILDSEDDVAQLLWGGNWRIPTKNDFSELARYCTWTWTSVNGVNGYQVSSNIPGYTDRSIFLPAAGYGTYWIIEEENTRGLYWTNEVGKGGNCYNAYYLTFSATGYSCSSYNARSLGYSIRPVSSYGNNITISLNVDSLSLQPDSTFQLIATVQDNGNTVDYPVLWSVENPAVATVDDYGLVTGVGIGVTTISAYNSGIISSCVVTVNKQEYVDLGLSVKWATCNIGAAHPEDRGSYFSWGETEPGENSEASYKWYKQGEQHTLIKYCNDSNWGYDGFVDNKTILDIEDDAAHVQWGGNWRIPTYEEYEELINNCTWTWTTQNGVKGYLVTSNVQDYTDKSIFLPLTGYKIGGMYFNVAESAYYWANSISLERLVEGLGVVRELWFNMSKHETGTTSYRYFGYPIRPVCP